MFKISYLWILLALLCKIYILRSEPASIILFKKMYDSKKVTASEERKRWRVPIESSWISQKLDNFNKADQRTWWMVRIKRNDDDTLALYEEIII